MLRPCFLVVDREFSTGISSRKLVIETAKFNVITAYGAHEAVETLKAFPAVHGVVIDEHTEGISCAVLVSKLKEISPHMAIVAIGSPGGCGPADYYVEPFSPAKLLDLLQGLRPKETASIKRKNQELEAKEGHFGQHS